MNNMSGGRVVWDFDFDDSKLTQGLDEASGKVDQFTGEISRAESRTSGFASEAVRSFDSIGNGLGRVLLGATALATTGSFGFVAMAKAAFDQVRAVEDASFALRAYERDGAKVNQILSELVAYARSDLGVLFQREELFKAASNLRGFGDAAEDVTDHVKTLSKGVALGYTNFDELSQIIGRATQQGKVSAEIFDMLAQRGIILNSSFRGAAVTTEQLYNELNRVLPASILEGRANTIGGMLIRLQSAFRDLGSAIIGVDKETSRLVKGGLGDTLVQSLGTTRGALRDPIFVESFKNMGKALADLAKVAIPVLIVAFGFLVQHMADLVAGFGALNVAFAAAQVGEFVSRLVMFVGNILAARGAISAATAAQWGFNAAMAANPIMLITTAVVAVAAALAYLQIRFNIFGKAWEAMQPIVGSVTSYIENRIERLKQIFGPFADSVVQALSNRFARAKQILADFGVSLEFGGATEIGAGLPARISAMFDRVGQIFNDRKERLKQIGQELMNSLAGRTEGQDNATLFDALNGALDRLQPILTAVKAALAPLGSQLALTGEIIKTQIAPAWAAFMETLKPFAEAIWPILKGALQGIAVVLGGLLVILAGAVVAFLGFATAIIGGIGNALPYIAQAFEGIIQFARGFIQLLTGIFTLNGALVMEGFKQTFAGAYGFVTNVLQALIHFVSGFVKTIITFFYELYMALIGGSIIPDIVNGIQAWIGNMVNWFISSIAKLVSNIVSQFVGLWTQIQGEVSQWGGRLKTWGENIARSFADGFSKLGDWLKEKITSALNSAKKFLQGQSPPIAGPFQNIDQWGYNVGQAWVSGVEDAINNVSFESPTLATSRGSSASQAPAVGGGGRQVSVNIKEMHIREEADITKVSQEIGFRVETSPEYVNDG